MKITRKTSLAHLYRYPLDYTPHLEYPETSLGNGTGHLFEMDPDSCENWDNPVRGFAYSVGDPKRGFPKNTVQQIALLTNEANEMVDCQSSFETCQGIKACSFTDAALRTAPHTMASREALATQRREERKLATFDFGTESGEWDFNAKIQQKTLVYFFSLMISGCRAAPGPPTVRHGEEKQLYDSWCAQLEEVRRGHSCKPLCDGRLLLCAGSKPHVRVSDELYDLDYLRALFNNDHAALKDIEERLAIFHNLGPLAPCTFTMNCSSVRVHCPFPHRNSQGRLVKAAMIRVSCDVKYQVYRPVISQRPNCPRLLVLSTGEHTHAIPGLSRTPPQIVDIILGLLRSMSDDIFDLTTRRFNRHPVVLAFLRERFPDNPTASLLDLHPSLTNQDHIRNWIDQQDTNSETTPYIRYMAEVSIKSSPQRICVCMTPESSRALLHATYIQTDIAFKRVTGYLEFELTVMDDTNPTSRMTRILSRIFVTEESAAMHQLIFSKISEIVKIDTGEELRWRHIHAKTLSDFPGICLVSVDQHRGQAKGLGMHLQTVARSMPVKPDLHEAHRTIQDLTEYDHLKRILRLCTIHLSRNIEKTGTTKEVKSKMRSLVCAVNPRWDQTVAEIRAEGGLKANNWVTDKEDSKFAFPAMCWEKSFIPKPIWDRGERTTNVSESGHADVNQEGTGCSLVGGYIRGLRFDVRKERTADIGLSYGVLPSYHLRTEESRALRVNKRKSDTQLRIYAAEDNKILDANQKMEAAGEKLKRARVTREDAYTRAQRGEFTDMEKADSSYNKAIDTYNRTVEKNAELIGTGSGKVGLRTRASTGDLTLPTITS
ncbi:hypothetical protein DFP72DRAFT_823014 [Ephemerocybe angulata]|uniref:Uncharacterized protein n=1 Tax=Ephemerocybe angulata TaxID=980116 RepID=A0A8H6HHU6_9AGAR|nr:hypothetical protein DFP72DRAFT_823014 [Tulosesus angulatus]